MIAVDTNILVYAHRRETDAHEVAAAVLRGLAEGSESWAIPWACCYEFLSVATNTRIWGDTASTQEQAWRQLIAWTVSPSNRLIGETGDFLEILSSFVQRPGVVGGMVHDARMVAICVAHGVEALLSRDRDFSLFPELRTRNPIRSMQPDSVDPQTAAGWRRRRRRQCCRGWAVRLGRPGGARFRRFGRCRTRRP